MARIKDITFASGSLTGADGADSTSGTVTLDSTSQLGGQYSARITSQGSYLQENFTATDTVFVSAYVKFTQLPSSGGRLITINDSGGTALARIVIGANSGGSSSIELWNNSALSGPQGSVSVNTIYRIGLRYTRSTGGNGVIEGYLAEGDAPFGSPFNSTTTNGTTTQAGRVLVGGVVNNSQAYWDTIRIDDAAMPGPDTGTGSGTGSGGGTGTHAVNLSRWRFYTDADDGSMVPLAAENTVPTLTGVQMQNATIRLRAQLHEIGSAAGSGSIYLEYSGNQLDYEPIAPQVLTDTTDDNWFKWSDGAGSAGSTLTSAKLTGSTQSGKYHEDGGTLASVGADAYHELDAAVTVRWPSPDTQLYFRLIYGGNELALASGVPAISFNTSSAAERPNTVAKLPDAGQTFNTDLRFSTTKRVFYDAVNSRYWLFYAPSADNTNLYAHHWPSSGAWTAAPTIPLGIKASEGRLSPAGNIINGVPVVFGLITPPGSNPRYLRGTINGTDITWSAVQTYSGVTTHRYGNVTWDDAGYIWIAGTKDGIGVWAARSTNPDTGTSWTPGFDAAMTVADSSVADSAPLAIIGVDTGTMMAFWYANNAIRYAAVTASGWSATASATNTAAVNPQDWSVTRGGDYIYLIHTDNFSKDGNWVLRVYHIPTATWSTATSAGVSGQGTDEDGIVVTRNNTDLYVFGTFKGLRTGNDRVIKYAKYSGPGASGTWGPLTQISPSDRGNGDHITGTPTAGGNKAVVIFEYGEDNIVGTPFTIEAWTVDIQSAEANGSGNATAGPATGSGTGTFTPPTYAGSGAAQAATATSAGSGTFTPPTYTGVGSAQAAQATASGSGTFVKPTFTGSGNAQAQPATASGSGTFTPVYAGSGNATAASATGTGSGTFVPPEYVGSGNVQASAATANGAGTFSPPGSVAGIGNAQAAAATGSGFGAFVPPTYVGSGTAQAATATATGTGAFVPPTFTGSGTAQAATATGSGTGIFGSVAFVGTGNAQAGPATGSGTGTFTKPVFLGEGVVQAGPATASGTGTFTKPTYLGSGNAQAATATASGTGTFSGPVDVPTFTGSGSAQAGPATGTGAGTFALPPVAGVFTGVGNAQAGPATAYGSGAFYLLVLRRKSNMGALVPLEIATGVTFQQLFVWQAPDGTRRSLAGLGAKMQIREKPGYPVLVELSTTAGSIELETVAFEDDTTGVILITISGEQSMAVRKLKGEYDVRLFTSASTNGEPSYRPVEGPISFDLAVTK